MVNFMALILHIAFFFCFFLPSPYFAGKYGAGVHRGGSKSWLWIHVRSIQKHFILFFSVVFFFLSLFFPGTVGISWREPRAEYEGRESDLFTGQFHLNFDPVDNLMVLCNTLLGVYREDSGNCSFIFSSWWALRSAKTSSGWWLAAFLAKFPELLKICSIPRRNTD